MNTPIPIPSEARSTAALLFTGSAAAWAAVFTMPGEMGMGVIAFLIAWTLMMAAMMLPSAAPFVLLFRRGATRTGTYALVAGYLLVWGVLGLPAYFAEMYFMHATLDPAPLALAAAGLYQLTPVKRACLQRCRTPADYLMQRWGRSAFRLGIEHGLWCVGCCWALMVVLVLAGSMGMLWVVGIAAVVALEKLTRHGIFVSHVTGVAMLLGAILTGVMR